MSAEAVPSQVSPKGTRLITEKVVRAVLACLGVCLLLHALYTAYDIRLFAVKSFGYLIHEFDPWFNFRATQYMSEHGWKAFFHWFDYASWYPLGRPVGSTTYPGLQITAVAIHRGLNAMGINMSLNDVCVLIPAWFSVIATLIVTAFAYELTWSLFGAGLCAYAFCRVPAHLMRSMAGEFDNECIALAAMLLTFYLWVRSLRCPRSWPIGVLAGLAYGYMVAAWGGYIFVINMVALHAGVCALNDWISNTYNASLLRSYALFYVVGTAIATRVPPVGMAPFKSLEQLSALMVLLFLFGLEMAERVRARTPDVEVRSRANIRIRFRVFSVMGGVLLFVAALLAPTGYFGPLSSRVRALFVAHTLTGNPLVDSVAEHTPATSGAYWVYLHLTSIGWTVGTFALAIDVLVRGRTPARTFVLAYSVVAYYFSSRMSRLMLLSGPVACVLTAYVVTTAVEGAVSLTFPAASENDDGGAAAVHKKTDGDAKPAASTAAAAAKRGRKGQGAKKSSTDNDGSALAQWRQLVTQNRTVLSFILIALAGLLVAGLLTPAYRDHCVAFAHGVANPMIAFSATLRNGQPIIVDDYLQAYLWLKNNTPTDARVLAWWDYGYQITGIAERTTLADGNTWNHEHIATIGKMLTSPVAEAHSLVRHMADYVLIWANQGGDLGKSPHMARIGNSVYRDICPADPLCDHFGFYGSYEQPTPMMRASLLYNLHEHGKKGVSVNSNMFREVHSSLYGLVRIYKVMNVSKESKQWVANPENRRCVSPGSWICPGQYPPAKEIQEMLAKRVDFSQIEDFNRKGKKDDAYYKAYMARSLGRG